MQPLKFHLYPQAKFLHESLNKESNSETVHAKKHPLGKSVASFAASVNAPINCVACNGMGVSTSWPQTQRHSAKTT